MAYHHQLPLHNASRLRPIVPKFGWIDCMPFMEKELAAMPVGLHVRTNGDGDVIGIGMPVNQEG